MATQVASLVISAEDKASAALGRVGKAFAELEKNAKAAGQLDKLSASMGKMRQQAEALDRMKGTWDGLKDARTRFSNARAEVERLGRAMAAAEKPSSQMSAAYRRAQREVSRAAEAFREQAGAAKDAKRGLEGLGLSAGRMAQAESQIATAVNRTNTAIEQQGRVATAAAGRMDALARANKNLAAGMGRASAITPDGRRLAAGMSAAGRVAATTGTMAAGALKEPGSSGLGSAVAGLGAGAATKKAFDNTTTNWASMDEAVRRQREILQIDEAQQASLKAQAYQIGKDTRFSNPDVIKGQTRIGSSLPDHLKDPKVIAAITENAKNYALAMGTTLDEGSSAILGRMLGLRMDMSTPEAAGASAKDAANKLVQFAKSSGADHNDVMGYTKFGAAPGSVGGFSPEFSDALAAQLRRIGYGGEMAGNFVRAAATKLSVPTSKGHGVLAMSGFNHQDYVKPGATPMSAENLSAGLKQRFGKGLTPDQLKRIGAVLEDEDTVGDRDKLIPALSAIAQEGLGKGKNGKGHAHDAERVTKAVNEFVDVSAGGVDIQRLMRDLIAKGITPAMAKYLFGQEHGGRAQALDLKTLDKDTEAFKNTPGNRAQSVGEGINKGFYGAQQRYQGSVETFWTRLGEVADGPLTKFYDSLGNAIDRISGLPDNLLLVSSAAGAAGAALLSLKGLASAGAALGLPGAAAVASGAGAGLAGVVGAGGGALATAMANEAAQNKDFAAPYLNGGMLGADPAGYGLGAAIHQAPDLAKQMSDENKRRLGSLPPGAAGMPAPALPRLPGLDGRPKRGFEGMMAPLPSLKVPAERLDAVRSSADDAKASVEALDGKQISISADTSAVDSLASKLKDLIGLFEKLTGISASATASVGTVARTSFSDS